MKTSATEKDAGVEPEGKSRTVDAEGTTGAGAAPPPPQLQVPGIPPGVLPQIDLESLGRDAEPEPFLAPTPSRGGMILGYGHARTGRVPPHGGSPSSGPLTGVPLMRPAPPAPPVFRKQALEPGHQVADPFLKVAASVEVPPRAPDDPLRTLERIERSAAAVRAARPRRPGAGAPRRIAAVAGPAGTGSAQLAASAGVPAAESVRASGQGTYVASRASGAKWEPEARVARDAANPCAPPGRSGPRPLTPLQSLGRYARQQSAAAEKVGGEPEAGASARPEVQPVGASGPGTKGLSAGTKALSKAKQGDIPGPRPSLAMAGNQDLEPPGADERRLLALRAQVSGLAGRFGARPRCLMDMTEVLRLPPGPGKWGRQTMGKSREGASAVSKAGASAVKARTGHKAIGERRGGETRTAPTPRGIGGSRQSSDGEDACALPQKYPARAGVAMREGAAAREAAPPGGPAQAEEGIATGRQSPAGQKAYPAQDGADAQARDEAAPGAGAPAQGAAPRPMVVAQGMGGPSTPLLLDLDRSFRREENARIDAQNAAEALADLAASSVASIKDAERRADLFLGNASIAAQLERAGQGMSGQAYAGYSGDLAEAVNSSLFLVAEVAAQGNAAKGELAVAASQLAATNEVAKQAVAALDEVRRQQRQIRERGRALGSMDMTTLRRRALEAGHRAERDAYRAERRALRRERGGVFKASQFAEVKAASERAFDQERKSARYQAQADRAKDGSAAQARAQRQADYHGSLAEAERHRASVARTHILLPEIARAKGARNFLKEERARSDEHYRNDRKLADMNRFRAAHEPRLEGIDRQIDDLVEKDGGFPRKENGKYVPKDPKDRAKVDRLQKEQNGLIKKLGTRLGLPGGVPGARTWAGINGLQRQNNQLAAAASGPFAGTPAGQMIRMLREPAAGIPPKVLSHLAAEVNSLMNEVIADASAKSGAALKAGLDAGIAIYDDSLTAEQRAAAGEGYAGAIGAATQAVDDIADAIETKRQNAEDDLAGYNAKEAEEDQERLAQAVANLTALLDVCNHPSCAEKKRQCEALSNEKVTCKLVPRDPPAPGDPDEPDPRLLGDGSSTSSVDASAPQGGGAVTPQGTTEDDGKDGPKEEKKDDDKPVEPDEAQDGERRTVSTEPKPDDKKKQEPKPPLPSGGTRGSVGKLFTMIGGFVESFGRAVLDAAKQILNPPVFLKPAPQEPGRAPALGPRPAPAQPSIPLEEYRALLAYAFDIRMRLRLLRGHIGRTLAWAERDGKNKPSNIPGGRHWKHGDLSASQLIHVTIAQLDSDLDGIGPLLAALPTTALGDSKAMAAVAARLRNIDIRLSVLAALEGTTAYAAFASPSVLVIGAGPAAWALFGRNANRDTAREFALMPLHATLELLERSYASGRIEKDTTAEKLSFYYHEWQGDSVFVPGTNSANWHPTAVPGGYNGNDDRVVVDNVANTITWIDRGHKATRDLDEFLMTQVAIAVRELDVTKRRNTQLDATLSKALDAVMWGSLIVSTGGLAAGAVSMVGRVGLRAAARQAVAAVVRPRLSAGIAGGLAVLSDQLSQDKDATVYDRLVSAAITWVFAVASSPGPAKPPVGKEAWKAAIREEAKEARRQLRMSWSEKLRAMRKAGGYGQAVRDFTAEFIREGVSDIRVNALEETVRAVLAGESVNAGDIWKVAAESWVVEKVVEGMAHEVTRRGARGIDGLELQARAEEALKGLAEVWTEVAEGAEEK